MAEPTDYTVSPFATVPLCVRPGLASDEGIEALETALRWIMAVPTGVAPPVVAFARRTLADLARIRADGCLTTINNQIAREFRLRPGDLQSKSHEQRIAFVLQLAMFLCRKITGAPFTSIGEHFHRDHSTVIHGYRVIEQRIRRDAAFRQFIEKLEGQITTMIQASAAAT
ncbi:MAG: helix-turn-helix domain-containing protein [Candidatus Binataceae bacterium]